MPATKMTAEDALAARAAARRNDLGFPDAGDYLAVALEDLLDRVKALETRDE